MSFSLPAQSERFVQAVKARTFGLIELNIWDIPKPRITAWLEQFASPIDEFFAACLLDSLVYRSRPQFDACAMSVFRGGQLRDVCKATVNCSKDLDLVHALRQESDPRVRLVPVIRNDQPPTKSGPHVLRYIKRALRLNDSWMIWPWQIDDAVQKHRVHTIIFVDDFLGTGQQFVEFSKTQSIPWDLDAICWCYAPMVAHRDGLQNLQKSLPKTSHSCSGGYRSASRIFQFRELERPHGWKDFTGACLGLL